MTPTIRRPGVIEDLAPVGLDELLATAELQTRVDRKYALTTGDLTMLLDLLPPEVRVLDIGGAREFGYASVYFDTPDRESFRAAAHRRRRRFKVRTRTYLASGADYLEVKTRDRGATVKDRLAGRHTEHGRLSPTGSGFVCRILAAGGIDPAPVAGLRPALTTTYRRTTLLLPGDGARVTLDTALAWSTPDGGSLTRPGLAIVETKSPGRASELDHVLWSLGFRPDRISKFGTGLAAMHPELPHNTWARTLRTHFAQG